MVLKDKQVRFSFSFVACAAISCSTSVSALEPVSYTDGPLQVIPQVSAQFGYDDNIFSTETDEVSSTQLIVTPSVEFKAEQGLNEYSVNYQLSNGTYQDSTSDNFTDHELTGRAYFDFNIRNRLELLAGYLDSHEDRGSGLTQGLNATVNDVPIEFHVASGQAAYEYGGQDAKGRIRLVLGVQDREHDNFRALTAERDRKNIISRATFYYRVLPRTSLLFEISHEDIDYDLSTSTLDSDEQKYLVGVQWEATAKTEGTFRIGYSEKNFDSDTRVDDDGISWELGMRWSPRSYSVVDIATSKEAEETDSVGNFIDRTRLNVQWTHAWSDLWRSRVFYDFTDDEFISDDRDDELTSFGFGVDYEMRRWLNFGLDYIYSERDSNDAGLDFEKNTIFITVQGSL